MLLLSVTGHKMKTNIYISDKDTWDVNNNIIQYSPKWIQNETLNSFVIKSSFYCLSSFEDTKVTGKLLSSICPLTSLSGTITFPFHLLRPAYTQVHWALSFKGALDKRRRYNAHKLWPLKCSRTKNRVTRHWHLHKIRCEPFNLQGVNRAAFNKSEFHNEG